jgi:stage V sporulation protein S
MNRFFSKLDLRDIKIDPTGSRFPPDGEVIDESEVEERYDEVEPATHEAAAPVEAVEETATLTEEEAGTTWQAPEEVAPAPAEQHSEVLKVSAKSRPSAVAGAIAGVVRELGRAEVQAIGAGATNQAVKAVAIARDYLRESGIEAVCLPAFIDVTIDSEDRTAIRLVIEPR